MMHMKLQMPVNGAENLRKALQDPQHRSEMRAQGIREVTLTIDGKTETISLEEKQ